MDRCSVLGEVLETGVAAVGAYCGSPDSESVDAVIALVSRVCSRLEGYRLGLIRYAGVGDRSALSANLGISRGEVAQLERTAERLAGMTALQDALQSGVVSVSKARIVAEALTPSRLDAGHTEETRLLELAATLAPAALVKALDRWGREVDTSGGVPTGERLRGERNLEFYRRHTGMTEMIGRLDPESGELIQIAIDAKAKIDWQDEPAIEHQTRTHTQRRVDALTGICHDWLTGICHTVQLPPARVAGTAGAAAGEPATAGPLSSSARPTDAPPALPLEAAGIGVATAGLMDRVSGLVDAARTGPGTHGLRHSVGNPLDARPTDPATAGREGTSRPSLDAAATGPAVRAAHVGTAGTGHATSFAPTVIPATATMPVVGAVGTDPPGPSAAAPPGPDAARTGPPGPSAADARLASTGPTGKRGSTFPTGRYTPPRSIPHLGVIIDLATLRDRNGIAVTERGAILDPDTARRIACDCGVSRILTNGPSAVLEAGREQRVVTGPLRKILVLRDQGCRWSGCNAAANRCQAHHITHWANGGKTDTTNCALLCAHHHHLTHEGGWSITGNANGTLTFTNLQGTTLTSHPPGHPQAA